MRKLQRGEKLEKGDVVTVRMKLVHIDSDGDTWLAFAPSNWHRLHPSNLDVVYIERPQLKVGDRVRWPREDLGLDNLGNILAVDGDFAWVRWNNGVQAIEPFSKLIFVPEKEK